MSGSEKGEPLRQNEYWEVSHAAGRLTSYACSLSAELIQDGVLRIEFNNEVACYMQKIVEQFKDGIKSFNQAIEEILEEQENLIKQASDYGKLVIGLTAGIYQVAGGITMCGGIVTCGIGALSIAHGLNNIFENGNNIFRGINNTQGPMRKLYKTAAQLHPDGTELHGDIAFGIVDLGLSGYGMLRRIPGKDARRLFTYIEEDLIRAYEQTGKLALGIDIFADIFTIQSVAKTTTGKKEN